MLGMFLTAASLQPCHLHAKQQCADEVVYQTYWHIPSRTPEGSTQRLHHILIKAGSISACRLCMMAQAHNTRRFTSNVQPFTDDMLVVLQ